MNADADLVKLIRDKADEYDIKSNDDSKSFQTQLLYSAKLDTCLELLKALGMTYVPNEKDDK